MLKNYILIAWRNLNRNKAYSIINIGGLAIGMSFALLIGLWIQYELSFDSFHQKRDRIGLVEKHTLFNDQKGTQDATPFPLAAELKSNYPEVKYATKVGWENQNTLVVGENGFNKTGIFVDPDFLKMFSFPVVNGDANTALDKSNSIILTRSTATSLFGEDDPIGKIVRLDNQFDMEVTGVVENIPSNSTIQFEFLGSYEFQVQNSEFIRNNTTDWSNNFLRTMVELKEGSSMEAFSSKIRELNLEKDDRLKNQFLTLHPLSDWHLRSDFKDWENVGGRIEYVGLFGVIGVFVLLIACINFMNLSTARSQKRAKEVGIRKTMGSLRRQLIFQFLSESVLTAFMAFLLSVFLIALLLPELGDFGFQHITLGSNSTFLIFSGLVVTIAVGLIAGSYPSLYLSSFIPVKVLKGLFRQGKGHLSFRRILVVSQFAISIGLIVSTVAVFQQIEHGKNRSIGYNPNNLISVRPTQALVKNFPSLKNELLESGYVEAVATASSPMTSVYNKWSDFSWDGKDPNADIAMEALMTEWDFEKVAQLKFIMGRPFMKEHATDSNAVILNKSAMKIIGYENPIGRTMKSGDREIVIVGVVEDLLMTNPFTPTGPGVILFNSQAVNAILLRGRDHIDLSKTLTAIDPILKSHNASQVYEYSFTDDDFNRKFEQENQIGKLSGIFAIIAIFISCLGLFGLSSFMVEQRLKEVGIRKILGASAVGLWRMLSSEFFGMAVVSLIISAPITYYLINQWLENYAYRTQLSWWLFVEVGIVVILISLVTVSFQTIKTIFTNPVENLRSE